MPVTSYMAKAMLDWSLGGAAANSPAARYLQFATAVPDANNAYDGIFGARKTVTFQAAASPDGGCSNANAIVGTASATGYTCMGFNLYDNATAGNRIAYGTTTAVSVGSGDAARFVAGALIITIS